MECRHGNFWIGLGNRYADGHGCAAEKGLYL